MNMRNMSLFLGIASLLLSCNSNDRKQQPGSGLTKDTTVNTTELTALDVEPKLRKADSLQILYYDDPDGDSLRYTRFFKYIITKDPTTINGLIGSLGNPVEKYSENKKCRSEGKIYVFEKQKEEPLKTIYFSTRCDTCCYLYYIKEGVFYYSSLSTNFKNKLKENKTLSRTP
jgi:hypothetical protein